MGVFTLTSARRAFLKWTGVHVSFKNKLQQLNVIVYIFQAIENEIETTMKFFKILFKKFKKEKNRLNGKKA